MTRRRNAVLAVAVCIIIGGLVYKYDSISLTNRLESFYWLRRGEPSLTSRQSYAVASRGQHNASHAITSVVILTYQRSGSSLTGDILQQSPGAFYVYEPLRTLKMGKGIPKIVKYPNGTVGPPKGDYVEIATSIIRSWSNCDIMSIYTQCLKDSFMDIGKATRKFKICMVRQKLLHVSIMDSYKTCALKLQRDCQKSKIRIIKTIRLPLVSVTTLLSDDLRLRTIHLVRDPRATLYSQSQLGKESGTDMCSDKHGGISGCTSRYCANLKNDINAYNDINSQFPGRIKRVYYEDIASSPVETAKELFNFVRTTFTTSAAEYIHNITSAGAKRNCAICTTRPNSTRHIDAWRRKIPSDFLKLIQNKCQPVMRTLGYKEVLE